MLMRPPPLFWSLGGAVVFSIFGHCRFLVCLLADSFLLVFPFLLFSSSWSTQLVRLLILRLFYFFFFFFSFAFISLLFSRPDCRLHPHFDLHLQLQLVSLELHETMQA